MDVKLKIAAEQYSSSVRKATYQVKTKYREIRQSNKFQNQSLISDEFKKSTGLIKSIAFRITAKYYRLSIY